MDDYQSLWKSWNNGGHFPIPSKIGKKTKKSKKKHKKNKK